MGRDHRRCMGEVGCCGISRATGENEDEAAEVRPILRKMTYSTK
jgi:hypothetical protein